VDKLSDRAVTAGHSVEAAALQRVVDRHCLEVLTQLTRYASQAKQ
jgi:hypothetical protein